MHRARCVIAVLAVLTAAAALSACTGSSGGPGPSGPASGTAASAGRPAPTGGTTSVVGGTTTTSGEATREDTGTVTVPRKPIRAVTVQGAHSTYVVRIWAELIAPACARYALGGKVAAFLRAHPCTRLDRYLATTPVGGKQVGLSVTTVTFAGAAASGAQSAAGLGALLGDPANGRIEDLFRTGRRLPNGPARLPASLVSNARNDGAQVTAVDAWYLPARRSAGDPGLSELVEALSS